MTQVFAGDRRVAGAISVAVSMILWASPGYADTSFAGTPDPLADVLWKHRLLVVCSASDEDDALAQGQHDVADWKGYLDRDLIFVWQTPRDLSSWKPVPDARKGVVLHLRFHPEDIYGVSDQTCCQETTGTVTLIGKDGTAKRQWTDAVSNDDLFAIIDAMPMRRQAMKDASGE